MYAQALAVKDFRVLDSSTCCRTRRTCSSLLRTQWQGCHYFTYSGISQHHRPSHLQRGGGICDRIPYDYKPSHPCGEGEGYGGMPARLESRSPAIRPSPLKRTDRVYCCTPASAPPCYIPCMCHADCLAPELSEVPSSPILVGVGTVLRLERDWWSKVEWPCQA